MQNIDDYKKLVELHKKEPDNEIWNKDNSAITQIDKELSTDNIVNENTTFECIYCHNTFYSKFNVKRHILTCKEKP